MSEKKMHKYTATIVGFLISISLSNQAACGPRGKNFLYFALSESSTLTSSIMSEALSHSSHGSQGSLGPEDSISQAGLISEKPLA
ncbi:hypothetical protein L873DRAFT_1843400, partial [Choiromyces venosus 120613-1]